MRTVLICHDDDTLDRTALPRWLAGFSELAGVVALRETRAPRWRRVKREWRRAGPLGFLDVLAFRAYHRVVLAADDRAWERRALEALTARYPEPSADVPVRVLASPNAAECEAFLRELSPDVVIARCKVLLAERIYSIPRLGTFVMHPGICPEYRNSHGCFWALANGERQLVGMTLLRIDRGVDTGPIHGYFRTAFDERRESHTVIQGRATFENLDAVAGSLREVEAGRSRPIDVTGRPSAAWGQPRLSAYLRYRRRARSAA